MNVNHTMVMQQRNPKYLSIVAQIQKQRNKKNHTCEDKTKMETFSEAVKQDKTLLHYDYIAHTHIQFSLEIARRHIVMNYSWNSFSILCIKAVIRVNKSDVFDVFC